MYFLLVGLALALFTPAYVVYAAPGLAGYLLHAELFLGQALPYLLCGALWLPWRSPSTAKAAFILSLLLLLASLAAYVPILWQPTGRGGDMVALAYVAISAALIVGVLLGSVVALLVIWVHGRSRRGRGRKPDDSSEY